MSPNSPCYEAQRFNVFEADLFQKHSRLTAIRDPARSKFRTYSKPIFPGV